MQFCVLDLGLILHYFSVLFLFWVDGPRQWQKRLWRTGTGSENWTGSNNARFTINKPWKYFCSCFILIGIIRSAFPPLPKWDANPRWTTDLNALSSKHTEHPFDGSYRDKTVVHCTSVLLDLVKVSRLMWVRRLSQRVHLGCSKRKSFCDVGIRDVSAAQIPSCPFSVMYLTNLWSWWLCSVCWLK